MTSRSLRTQLRSELRSLLLGALVMAACGVALPALAQFNGPGIGTGVEINKPTVLTTDRTLLYPGVRDLQLGPGDVLTLHVFGQIDYAPTVRIGTDGQVLLPLIGIVSLQGLTVTAAEQLVAQKLQSAGMFKDPQVTIQVVEGPNAVVTVVGEAHGVIPIAGSRRLLDVLAAAGGLPASASHILTINRPGLAQPLTIDLGTDPARSELANIPVFAGDTIIVARTGVVYVVGAFKTQGAIPLVQNTPLTLLEATALSGGPTFDAKYDDLRIVRTIGDRRTVVKLDIKKVLYGRAADPLLQPNDIIFLPSSTLKAAIQSGGLGVLLSAASLAVTAIAIR